MTNVTLPRTVTVYEVGLRDGLQNEKTIVPTEGKLRLAAALADAGLTRLEAASFVRPDWIAPLADADEVVRRLPRRAGVRWGALVPNAKGLDRALAAGLPEIAVFISASETHNKKNINRTIAESLAEYRALVPRAVAAGLGVRAYVSCVWGCPFEGKVDPRRALEIALELEQLGVEQLSLGDTIGVGTPLQTRAIVELFLGRFAPSHLALHLHDTRGIALANALAGLELGIDTIDASVGGLGGCPYAPGAAGNLATEDLVYMLHGMGIETGVDLAKLVEAGRLAQELVGHPLTGRYLKAALAGQSAGMAGET